MRILLIAEESAGIQVLRGLAQTDHELAAVLTTRPTRGGGSSVATVAAAAGVPLRRSEEVRSPELADWIRSQEIDVLLNVHSLFVIHPAVVSAPRIGSFNLHPGPLPQYAGLNAPSWAIYFGETRHAVTLHWMAPGIDTGAIAYATEFAIAGDDTGLSVSRRCVREGIPLVQRLLDAAAADPRSIPIIPQDLTRRRYFGRQVPNAGRILWSQPARQVVDFVRACDYFPFPSPWRHPLTRLRDCEIAVLKASRTGETAAAAEPGTIASVQDHGAARVAAADEWVLVQRVKPEHGEPVSAAEVLAEGQRLDVCA